MSSSSTGAPATVRRLGLGEPQRPESRAASICSPSKLRIPTQSLHRSMRGRALNAGASREEVIVRQPKFATHRGCEEDRPDHPRAFTQTSTTGVWPNRSSRRSQGRVAAHVHNQVARRTRGGPVTAGPVIEEWASFDSAAGWALQAGNTGAWWGLDSRKRAPKKTSVPPAFSPPPRSIRRSGDRGDGGYRITGRGPLASNITTRMALADGHRPTTAITRALSRGSRVNRPHARLRARRRSVTPGLPWDCVVPTATHVVVQATCVRGRRRRHPPSSPIRAQRHYRGPISLPGLGEVGLIAARCCSRSGAARSKSCSSWRSTRRPSGR